MPATPLVAAGASGLTVDSDLSRSGAAAPGVVAIILRMGLGTWDFDCVRGVRNQNIAVPTAVGYRGTQPVPPLAPDPYRTWCGYVHKLRPRRSCARSSVWRVTPHCATPPTVSSAHFDVGKVGNPSMASRVNVATWRFHAHTEPLPSGNAKPLCSRNNESTSGSYTGHVCATWSNVRKASSSVSTAITDRFSSSSLWGRGVRTRTTTQHPGVRGGVVVVVVVVVDVSTAITDRFFSSPLWAHSTRTTTPHFCVWVGVVVVVGVIVAIHDRRWHAPVNTFADGCRYQSKQEPCVSYTDVPV